jgi:hypothetical protein
VTLPLQYIGKGEFHVYRRIAFFFYGELERPGSDISVNECRAVARLSDGYLDGYMYMYSLPSHARGIHILVAVHQSLQRPPSTLFIPLPHGP